MNYYYVFELHDRKKMEIDADPAESILHSHEIETEEQVIQLLKSNLKIYLKSGVTPQIIRKDRYERFIVILEKGSRMGYNYFSFLGKDPLLVLQKNTELGLHRDDAIANTSFYDEGVLKSFSIGLINHSQYFMRPWNKWESDAEHQVSISNAIAILNNLTTSYAAIDFNPVVDHKFSSYDWGTPFRNIIKEIWP